MTEALRGERQRCRAATTGGCATTRAPGRVLAHERLRVLERA
jgi:hypothetical protein